ncbi:hypothetical protein Tco_1482436 [Tanacetum coccineum]
MRKEGGRGKVRGQDVRACIDMGKYNGKNVGRMERKVKERQDDWDLEYRQGKKDEEKQWGCKKERRGEEREKWKGVDVGYSGSREGGGRGGRVDVGAEKGVKLGEMAGGGDKGSGVEGRIKGWLDITDVGRQRRWEGRGEMQRGDGGWIGNSFNTGVKRAGRWVSRGDKDTGKGAMGWKGRFSAVAVKQTRDTVVQGGEERKLNDETFQEERDGRLKTGSRDIELLIKSKKRVKEKSKLEVNERYDSGRRGEGIRRGGEEKRDGYSLDVNKEGGYRRGRGKGRGGGQTRWGGGD